MSTIVDFVNLKFEGFDRYRFIYQFFKNYSLSKNYELNYVELERNYEKKDLNLLKNRKIIIARKGIEELNEFAIDADQPFQYVEKFLGLKENEMIESLPNYKRVRDLLDDYSQKNQSKKTTALYTYFNNRKKEIDPYDYLVNLMKKDEKYFELEIEKGLNEMRQEEYFLENILDVNCMYLEEKKMAVVRNFPFIIKGHQLLRKRYKDCDYTLVVRLTWKEKEKKMGTQYSIRSYSKDVKSAKQIAEKNGGGGEEFKKSQMSAGGWIKLLNQTPQHDIPF